MSGNPDEVISTERVYRRRRLHRLDGSLAQLEIIARDGIDTPAYREAKADALRASREAPPYAHGSGSPAVDMALEIAAIEAEARQGGDPGPAAPRAPQEAGEGAKGKGPRTRRTRLSTAIRAALDKLGEDATADQIYDYLAKRDDTGIIVDETDEKLTWLTSNGKPKDTKRKTIANMVSAIRKEIHPKNPG